MNRSGVRFVDLGTPQFGDKLKRVVNSAHKRFKFEYDVEAEIKRYEEYYKKLASCIIDGVQWINQKYSEGKKILVEGANAAMLDIDFGTYPFVTSSNPTIGGCITGLGLAPQKLSDVIGVVKAYTTRVGEGPFPTELLDETGEKIRAVGREFGTTTGRPRRCGWLDVVVLRYSTLLNGYTALNLTKLDILSGLTEVKIGVAYTYQGKQLSNFPARLDILSAVQVEYETLPGWAEDISKCEKFSDLPVNCQNYVKRIEQLVGVPIRWTGVGPSRAALISH